MDASGQANDLGPILIDKILRVSEFIAQAFNLLPGFLGPARTGKTQGCEFAFV